MIIKLMDPFLSYLVPTPTSFSLPWGFNWYGNSSNGVVHGHPTWAESHDLHICFSGQTTSYLRFWCNWRDGRLGPSISLNLEGDLSEDEGCRDSVNNVSSSRLWRCSDDNSLSSAVLPTKFPSRFAQNLFWRKRGKDSSEFLLLQLQLDANIVAFHSKDPAGETHHTHSKTHWEGSWVFVSLQLYWV